MQTSSKSFCSVAVLACFIGILLTQMRLLFSDRISNFGDHSAPRPGVQDNGSVINDPAALERPHSLPFNVPDRDKDFCGQLKPC